MVGLDLKLIALGARSDGGCRCHTSVFPCVLSWYIQRSDVRLCTIRETTSLRILAVTIDEVERDWEVADTYHGGHSIAEWWR
jgi:hypothetical protein